MNMPTGQKNSMSLQPYKENYMQLRNAEDGTGGLLQGKAHQLVIPENKPILNTLLTEEIKLKNIYVYAYIYNNNEKRGSQFESGGCYIGGLGARKGEENVIKL